LWPIHDVNLALTTALIPAFRTCGNTNLGKFVGVAIPQADLDPMIINGLVQSSLEISIPHIDKMIASKYTARKNSMLHENAEDLAPYFFISYHFVRPAWMSNRQSHSLAIASSAE